MRLPRGMFWMLVVAVHVLVGCPETTPKPDPEADVQNPDTGDAADILEVTGQDTTTLEMTDGGASGCPTVHPWLADPMSWDCDLPIGTVCTWAAESCEPGAKPDNVCTCLERPGGDLEFECVRPFHNCLPLEGSDVPAGTLVRPLPKHRESPEPCEATPEAREEAVCSDLPMPADRAPECEGDADCDEAGARCLETWQGMGASLCTCHTAECIEDTDCPGLAVCSCGQTAVSASYCGGPSHKPCHHECLPSDCQTDADCGEGKLCSPSWDICGWHKNGYFCHDPETAECFNDWECMDDKGNWGCIHENGTGWTCNQPPPCD